MQERLRGLGYIERIQRKFGVTFEEGRNPDVEFMAHLWEPLRWMHKPLVVYIGAEAIWLGTDCLLRALGFRAYKHHNVSMQPCPPMTCYQPGGQISMAFLAAAAQGLLVQRLRRAYLQLGKTLVMMDSPSHDPEAVG